MKNVPKISENLGRCKTSESDFTSFIKDELEIFLNKIIENKIYITDEVLKFLKIYDEDLAKFLDRMRKMEQHDYKFKSKSNQTTKGSTAKKTSLEIEMKEFPLNSNSKNSLNKNAVLNSSIGLSDLNKDTRFKALRLITKTKKNNKFKVCYEYK